MSHVAPSGPSASELDVFACPLDGVNQIEASAGTGKTWNICALYVRLLLEKDLGADEILVVTFTKAATAELHERIRARLAQLAHALDTGDDGGDPFIARLFETTLAPERGLDPQTAAKRVRRALRAFDQAAIHTIHAFCQRALQEAPFAAAMPFAFEMEADDGALRFELAADFWRTRVEPVAAAYPAFAEWLVEYGAGPAALDAQLARRLKKPLARLRWDGLHAADDGAESAARAHFDTAAAIWRDERGVLGTLLADAQPSLNQRSHKPEAVSEALDAWARYFEQASAVAALPRAALKLTQSALEKATKKGGATPRHAFFDVAQALEAAVAALEAAQRAAGCRSSSNGSTRRPPSSRSASARAASYRSTICSRTCIARSTRIRGCARRCARAIRPRSSTNSRIRTRCSSRSSIRSSRPPARSFSSAIRSRRSTASARRTCTRISPRARGRPRATRSR